MCPVACSLNEIPYVVTLLNVDGSQTLHLISNNKREQVPTLLECQMENWLLCFLAGPDAATAATGSNGGEEMAQIALEL